MAGEWKFPLGFAMMVVTEEPL